MTTAAIQYPFTGTQPLGNVNSFVEVADSTTYRPIIPLGTIVSFVDPYYGPGEAIRLAIPTSTAVTVGQVSIWSAATVAGILTNYSYVAAPVTANQSRGVAFCLSSVPSNATFAQYAWFGISGASPINFTVAAAITDSAWISATAGRAFVTITAGRQLLGVRPVVASTGTVVKTATTQSGSPIIKVANTDGWFVGGSVSGTGIVTSLITNIDVNNNVTLASNASASGSVSATMTLNDASTFYPICTYNRPVLQGNAT